MRRICLLGSTGSIGTQTLEVCRQYPEDFEILALSAKSNIYLLAKQIIEFKPKRVCLYDEDKLEELQGLLEGLDYEVKIHVGEFGLLRLVKMEKVDVVVNALVGFVGFMPTLQAIVNQKTVALANKESLVVGGSFIMRAARTNNVDIIPIDSEHSAIFQSMMGNNKRDIKKVILTASGGPFFGYTKKDLKKVKPEDALKHPNWSMGAKVTIDSATMMNKGLELIEACWLFNLRPSDVEIVVHRESIVHSMVEYVDNSTIAQLSTPDMKIPIQYSLTYPNRLDTNTKALSLIECGKLTFNEPDDETFICLKACKLAIEKGGLYPAIVNGANEEAVKLFLENKIKFTEIGEIVLGSLDVGVDKRNLKVDDVIEGDKIGRRYALGYIAARGVDFLGNDIAKPLQDNSKSKKKKSKKAKKSKTEEVETKSLLTVDIDEDIGNLELFFNAVNINSSLIEEPKETASIIELNIVNNEETEVVTEELDVELDAENVDEKIKGFNEIIDSDIF